MIAANLRLASATVHTAPSVREALRVFTTIEPHVVVCDIAMPDEDGYSFVREIRSRGDAFRTTPILALTAFGLPEDRLLALNAGVDAYPPSRSQLFPDHASGFSQIAVLKAVPAPAR